MLKIGQEVKVQVIKYDEATKRVSLGMKQLQQNPWESIAQRYNVGSTLKGKVTNITSYGAFVEIEQGIEGLVHVSEMSWLKNNSSPNKFINVGQEVEVMVLDVNSQNHRISLGMKQCEKNPWQAFSEKNKVGDVVQGVIKNFTEFGLFVGFDSGVDGLVHVSDISNDGINEEVQKKFKAGEKINVMVFLFVWIRAALPRYRYDQLMSIGWKVFLPISLAYVFSTASILISFNYLPF
jgi:small subunit ribosomal protein S1